MNWVTPYLRGVGYRCCAMEWRALASGLGFMFFDVMQPWAMPGPLYWCAGSRRTGCYVRVRCAPGDTSAGVWIVAAVPCKQGASSRHVEIYTLRCRCCTTSGGVRVGKRHRVYECVCASTGCALSWLVVPGVIRRCAELVLRHWRTGSQCVEPQICVPSDTYAGQECCYCGAITYSTAFA